ncbi:hypothetical protein M2271_002293 [Streptomyces sp. LBL]|nr:hypothetical protein [Streptomyces sp. LBL]
MTAERTGGDPRTYDKGAYGSNSPEYLCIGLSANKQVKSPVPPGT